MKKQTMSEISNNTNKSKEPNGMENTKWRLYKTQKLLVFK